jgi:hypothetical protein
VIIRYRKRNEKNPYINNTSQMPLHRRTTQQQINLIIIIPISPQIFNAPESSLPIGHGSIQEMLFTIFINTEAFKINISARTKIGLHGSGYVDWRLHVQVRDAVFEDGEFDGDAAGHFNGAAKGDFAVALGEVEVAYAEFCAGHVDGEVDF